jgi:hypothetical protein
MGLTSALVGLAVVAGIGGLATSGSALAFPAAATVSSTTSAAPSTAVGGATSTTPAGTPAGSSAAPRCDDGSWRGPDGINVEGRPRGLDAGDRGSVYLWHNADGWHLRTTDITNDAHHYTGAIALSDGARFTSFAPVRLEHGDRVWVDGTNTLHYDFTTYNGVDGINFTVSACDGARDHELMRFTMDINGHEDDPSRIALGANKQHPDSATFTVTRTV